MKIVVIDDSGEQEDVTEAVQVAYDAVRNSMDWGSGFLSSEEMGQIVDLGRAAKFPDYEEALRDKEAMDREAAERRKERELSTSELAAVTEAMTVERARMAKEANEIAELILNRKDKA